MEAKLDRCRFQTSRLCNVCGLYTPKSKASKHHRKFTEPLKLKYFEKFRLHPVLDKSYAPHTLCTFCVKMLNEYQPPGPRGEQETPMIWREPDTKHYECYACQIPDLEGICWGHRENIMYPPDLGTKSRKPSWRLSRSKEIIKPETVEAMLAYNRAFWDFCESMDHP